MLCYVMLCYVTLCYVMLCPCYVDIIRQKKHIYLFITFFMYNYVGARGGAVG